MFVGEADLLLTYIAVRSRPVKGGGNAVTKSRGKNPGEEVKQLKRNSHYAVIYCK